MPIDDTTIITPDGGTNEFDNDSTIGGSTGNGPTIDATMSYNKQLKSTIEPLSNRVVTPNMFVGGSETKCLSHQEKVKRIDTGSGQLTQCYAVSEIAAFTTSSETGIIIIDRRQFVLENDGASSGDIATNYKKCATFSQLHQNNGLYGTIPIQIQPVS